MRSRGGIIAAALPTWTTGSTNGIFSLREAQEMMSQSQWPSAPNAPTNLAASGQDSAIALTWTAPVVTNGTITNYLIEYTPSGGQTTAVLSNTTNTAFTITGLVNNTVYAVRVAAVNFTAGQFASATATPSSSISPSSIPGLQLWYDADAANTLFNATSGGTQSGNGGDVLRIEDRSGNGRHAIRAASGHKAIRRASQLNGKGILDLGQIVASGAPGVFTVTNGQTMTFLHRAMSTGFFVIRPKQYPQINGFLTRHSVLASTPAASTNAFSPGLNVSVELTYNQCDKNGCTTFTQNRVALESRENSASAWRYTGVSQNNAVSDDQWVIISFSGNMAASLAADRGRVWKHNTDLVLTESGPAAYLNANTANYTLFGTSANGFYTANIFNGHFAEAIIYDSVISDANRNGIHAYLSNKWGIT
jgi:hypothetical protein